MRNQKEKNNKNTKLARKKRNLSLFLAQKREEKAQLIGVGGRGEGGDQGKK